MGKNKKVLAVASAGGHWVQLYRMRPAWKSHQIAYLTTQYGYFDKVRKDAQANKNLTPEFFCVTDANLNQKARLLLQVVQILIVILRYRPDVIISTGAAIGFFALKIGHLFGIKTIWVDSIANAETMSLSGKKVSKSADLWLTQWPHIAKAEADHKGRHPSHKGSII